MLRCKLKVCDYGEVEKLKDGERCEETEEGLHQARVRISVHSAYNYIFSQTTISFSSVNCIVRLSCPRWLIQ